MAASNRVARRLHAVGSVVWPIVGVLVLAWVAIQVFLLISAIVISLGIALLIAALLQPAVAVLRRWRLPNWLATVLVLIAAFAFLGGLGTFTVNSLISGISGLRERLQHAIAGVHNWLVNGPLKLSEKQLDAAADNVLGWLRDQVQVASAAFALVSAITGIALVVFVLVFFIYDGERIWQMLLRTVPEDVRPRADRSGRAAFDSLGSFVRATILVAIVDAVIIGTGLAILGVPLVIPLASLIFLGAFVPYIGATVSGLVAILVALVSGGWLPAVIVTAIVLGVQFIEGNILQPLILGKAVRLHPVAVVLAVAAGITLWGIAGALLAVPVLVVVRALISTA